MNLDLYKNFVNLRNFINITNCKCNIKEEKNTKIYSAIEELVKLSKNYKKQNKFKYIKTPFKIYDDEMHQSLFLCLAGIDSLYTKTELEQLYESVFSMNIKNNNFFGTLLNKFESRSFMLYRNFFNDSSSKLNVIKELKYEIENEGKPVSELILKKFQMFEDEQRNQEDHRLHLCREIRDRDKKYGRYKVIFEEIEKEMKKRDETLTNETDTKIFEKVLKKHIDSNDNIYITESFEKTYLGNFKKFVIGFSKAYYNDKKRFIKKFNK